MRVFRRVMLGGGDNFPEDWIIYYTADEKINSIGFKVLSNTFNPTSGKGKIINNGIITSFPRSCFGGTKIKTINIPNSVTVLEALCLADTQLTELTIPDSVVTIEGSVSQSNEELRSVTIGANVEILGSGAFQNNPNLEEVYFKGNNIKKIYAGCFDYNPKLKKIICNYQTFPESLANIVQDGGTPTINGAGFYYFDGSLLTSLRLVGDVNAGAYKNCYGLSSIFINDCSVVNSSAFQGITSEKDIWVNISSPESSGYLRIESGAFKESDVYSFAVSWHSGLNIEIYDEAFYLCKKLSEISLYQVKYIGDFCFVGCTNLQYIIFDKVFEIGDYAFSGCTSMKRYDFSNNTGVPIIGAYVFNYIPTDCEIIVPDALYDEWIAATNWSTYASYIIKKSDWDASQTTE